jgi:hypothetical protein
VAAIELGELPPSKRFASSRHITENALFLFNFKQETIIPHLQRPQNEFTKGPTQNCPQILFAKIYYSMKFYNHKQLIKCLTRKLWKIPNYSKVTTKSKPDQNSTNQKSIHNQWGAPLGLEYPHYMNWAHFFFINVIMDYKQHEATKFFSR